MLPDHLTWRETSRQGIKFDFKRMSSSNREALVQILKRDLGKQRKTDSGEKGKRSLWTMPSISKKSEREWMKAFLHAV